MAKNMPSLLSILFLISTISSPVLGQLSVGFYAMTCPSVFDTVRTATRAAINADLRMGASLIRLFFHDCFVNGCDAGVLLDATPTVASEKDSIGNANSLRGFDVMDTIKTQVDAACGATVVSCADILAIAARDSVVELGGTTYAIPVGRRDALAPSTGSTGDLPAFFEDLPSLLDKFNTKGFTPQEMVVLSGAHTIGRARCVLFRDRIYNETNIDPAFATAARAICPSAGGPPGDDNLANLDSQTPNGFDNAYFTELINLRGLLHTDQVLFNGGSTDAFVTTYSNNPTTFNTDFGNAMIKLGNLSPLTGTNGQIRTNCRRIN